MSFSELNNAQRTQNTARYAEERKNAQSVTPGGKKFFRRSHAGIVVGYIVLTLLSVLWLLPIFYLLYTLRRIRASSTNYFPIIFGSVSAISEDCLPKLRFRCG